MSNSELNQQLATIVFSDLDGTLLDHYSYSHAAATPCITQLKQMNIPVIINTSKTYAEVKNLVQRLALNTPFIVENGAAICFPDGARQVLASPRKEKIAALKSLPKDMQAHFVCFSDMSNAQISKLTGLDVEQAQLANQRDYAEPVHWLGTAAQKVEFIKAIENEERQVVEGGRFLHIGSRTDKGKALLLTKQFYAGLWRCHAKQILSVALGDGNNDVAMLNVADIAVLVHSPVHNYPKVSKCPQVIRTTAYGPEGWHEAISALLPNLPFPTQEALHG